MHYTFGLKVRINLGTTGREQSDERKTGPRIGKRTIISGILLIEVTNQISNILHVHLHRMFGLRSLFNQIQSD